MNQKQIKQLEANLWDSADNLRANSKLTAAEYKDPVLGLILLRYAQNRYERTEKKKIEQERDSLKQNTEEQLKPLTPKERNSLLIIIGALCNDANIDYNQRGIAVSIEKMTEILGAPVTDDTIRNILKQIDDAVSLRSK